MENALMSRNRAHFSPFQYYRDQLEAEIGVSERDTNIWPSKFPGYHLASDLPQLLTPLGATFRLTAVGDFTFTETHHFFLILNENKEEITRLKDMKCGLIAMVSFWVKGKAEQSNVRNHPVLIHCKRGKVGSLGKLALSGQGKKGTYNI
ncbi:hypothetical protein M9H77_07674 [Catharanthus roseus]|uniref:Uncharacterized protein n=1 Tax=Catharanthus roseus TaxID=4058 RepID=A0ACC0BVX2_CATRO|nr:hypothetical protein M9H77_07674 [Catharanthus roseus]